MRFFSTTVLILLSNGAPAISSSKHFFVLFTQTFFLVNLISLSLSLSLSPSLLGLESFGSFHLVSEFLVLSYSLTASCEYWLPCIKLSLHYENIDIYMA